jgi:hypothetical protein
LGAIGQSSKVFVAGNWGKSDMKKKVADFWLFCGNAGFLLSFVEKY